MNTKKKTVTIFIKDWVRHNPRKDVKVSSWFRFDHSFFENPEFFDLSLNEKAAYVYLLCLASKKNGPNVQINCRHASRVARIPAQVLISAIDKLTCTGVIQVEQDDDLCHSAQFSGLGQAVRERDEDGTRTSRVRDVHAMQTSSEPDEPVTSASSTNERTDDTIRDATKREDQHERGADACAFISAYCSAWKSRYGCRPAIVGKDQAIAKRLTKDLGKERAVSLVGAFLRMDTEWYIVKRHDLPTLESNLNAVSQFLETGAQVTTSQARRAEKLAGSVDQLQRIAEGTL